MFLPGIILHMLNIFLAIPTVNIPEHLSPTILIAFLESSFAPLAKIIFFPFIFSIPNSELVQSTSLFSSIFKTIVFNFKSTLHLSKRSINVFLYSCPFIAFSLLIL